MVFAFGGGVAFGLSRSTGPGGSNAQAVHARGYTGQGVTIGLISRSHARCTHEAFAGAVRWYDATGENSHEPFWHDTSMAGILCSRGGVLYPDHKGVAPGSEVLTVRVTQPTDDPKVRAFNFDWLEDALEEIKTQNGRVVVTGIQFPGTADGGSRLSLIYDYYAYEHDMIFATASGNDATSITVFGDTFNSITTAGLILENSDCYNQIGTASNPGRTADERRKPDIAAPTQDQWAPTSRITNNSDTLWGMVWGEYNEGLTSWAVPHTAGAAALLLSYADTTEEPDDGRGEVIKAVIVNSAFPNINDKSGNWTDPNQFTWHPHRGYGRIDALQAFETLSRPKVFPGGTIVEPKGWAYRVFSESGMTDSYWIYGTRNFRLLLTMTWHRAVQFDGQHYHDEPSPRLNLDLNIYDPNGSLLFSDAGTKDNLRKADIQMKSDGFYEVRITNTTDNANRAYALAFETLEMLSGDLNNNFIVDEADLEKVMNSWLLQYDMTMFRRLSSQWLRSDQRYCVP